MKNKKRFLAIMMAVVMSVATFASTPAVTTQAKVKIIVGKKLNLSIGESEYVVAKGKGVTYKSSNKKIATVNKKGLVVAKSAGNCKITVMQGGSKATAKVNVTPAKVKIQSVATVGSSSGESLAQKLTLKVTWKKAKNVSGYYVYYATSKNGKYTKKTVKGAKKTSTTLTNLVYGNTYFVKVKAYGGKKKVASKEDSKVLSVKTYKKVWSDEFNYTDKSKLLDNWSYEVGHGDPYGWGNRELEHYTDNGENVSLNGSALVIQPKKETIQCGGKSVTEYTSARMISRGNREFQYGKIEFRAQLPSAQGTWAALWMLGNFKDDKGNTVGWPDCGEIDIMETLSNTKTGLFQLDKIPQTIHCRKYNGMSSSSGPKHHDSIVKGSTTGYHTYGIEWNEKQIDFYIDGKKTWTYSPSQYVTKGDGTDDPQKWPYKHNFYLLMNVAIGGTLGGGIIEEDGSIKKHVVYDNEVTGVKGQMKVDYVRVYQ